jgi:hypothetical protein
MFTIKNIMPARMFQVAAMLVLLLAGGALRAEETATAIEFYNGTLKHYFISADSNEISGVDAGAAGPGWSRTGLSFKVWGSAASAAGLSPVCRFYGTPGKGPNGHFYTADPVECDLVKRDAGWTYEGIAFYVRRITPGATGSSAPAGMVNGCASTDAPVYRSYNNRFAQGDSNHRYASDSATYGSMAGQNWLAEGVVFCARGASVNYGDYFTFSLNTQDFAYPDLSIAALGKVVDTHERYQIPVDVYLTTLMTDLYEQMAPDLLARLRTSPWVALTYHTRPPLPYYDGYDWAGLGRMSYAEQYAAVMNYETHGLDLATGLPTAASGGFGKIKTLLGSAPVLTAFLAGPTLENAVSDVYRDLGAKMRIVHGRIINAGEKQRDLYIRPEHVDMILLEHFGENITTALDAAVQTAHGASGARAPYFVGVKMHDNDFFADHSAWTEIYVSHGRKPNWDLSYKSPLLDATSQASRWATYEGAVAYASANRSRIGSLNGPGLLTLVSAATGATASTTTSTATTTTTTTSSPVMATPKLYVSGNMHIESRIDLWPNVDNLIAFFRQAVTIGKVGTQASPMRWSLGADIGWLQNEPRAHEALQILVGLGVELDVHAHNVVDRAITAELLHNWGLNVTQVLNGANLTDVDGARNVESTASGYQWQAKYLWGFNRTNSHGAGSDDLAIGLWRPKSSAEYTVHDPNGSLLSIGNGNGSLSTIESFVTGLGSSYTAPVYSASVSIQPWVLKVGLSGEDLDGLSAFANRVGASPNLRWATNREICEAWVAAGSVASRIDLPDL